VLGPPTQGALRIGPRTLEEPRWSVKRLRRLQRGVDRSRDQALSFVISIICGIARAAALPNDRAPPDYTRLPDSGPPFSTRRDRCAGTLFAPGSQGLRSLSGLADLLHLLVEIWA